MNLTSIGDLARTLTLQSRSTQIKSQIGRLTQELSSGQTSDVNTRLAGDYAQLTDLDRNLTRLGAYRTAAAETGLRLDAIQDSLKNAHDRVNDLSAKLVSFAVPGQDVSRELMSVQARDELSFLVATLNGSVAGRSLFAGQDVDVTALAGDQTLLDSVRAAISGHSSPDDMIQAAKDWFSDPAGFETVIYQGSDRDLAPVQVSDGQTVGYSLRADDVALRNMLRDTALAALATDPALGLSDLEQSDLLAKTGASLLDSRDALVALRAETGLAQSRVETARGRNAASATAFEYARRELLEADPFETATRLEAAQFQLESLYAATVRSSQLSLVNFLR